MEFTRVKKERSGITQIEWIASDPPSHAPENRDYALGPWLISGRFPLLFPVGQ
jgi:hypothetical protein